MDLSKRFILSAAVILASITITLACNGYKMTFLGTENCDPNNNIFIHDDFTVTMDENCDIIPVGCVDIKHGFSKAVGMYRISKPPLPPIQGNVDFCEALEKYADQLDVFMDLFGIPKRCPYEAANYCMDGSKKVNLGPMKSKLSMAVGKIEIFFNVTQDDTMPTCIKTNLQIDKPKKAKSG